MIGRKSLFASIKVKNVEAGNTTTIVVQSDKLYRICDVIFPVLMIKPMKPADTSDREAMKTYKAAKKNYDLYLAQLRAKRQVIINKYRGRQSNDSGIMGSIRHDLFNLVNA